MNKITAHVMVRNEEYWIGHILIPVLQVFEHVIIADTGSSDDTLKIVGQVLQGVPNEKYELIVTAPLTPKENGEMRQHMTDITPTEWAMIVDGDEYYTIEALEKLMATDIPETARLGFTLLETLHCKDRQFWGAETWNKQATFHAKTTKWHNAYPWEGPSWYNQPETFFYYPAGVEGYDFHHLQRSSKDAMTPHRLDNTRSPQPLNREVTLSLDLWKWPNPYCWPRRTRDAEDV